MRTLQGMRMNVDYMMEQIRINAINDTFEKFKQASRHYYETCEGGSEVTSLIKELDDLGANMEYIFEIDLEIRNEVFGL